MPGVSLKAIKPSSFNKNVFRLALIKEQSKIAKNIETDYIKTTKKWKKKPTWIRSVRIKGTLYIMFVGTENKIYGYIDYGTKPHPIFPKRAKVLRWRGSSYSGRGRPKQSDYVFAAYVRRHPGFKGYKHSKRLVKKWRPLVRSRSEAALARAAKQSGHYIK